MSDECGYCGNPDCALSEEECVRAEAKKHDDREAEQYANEQRKWAFYITKFLGVNE